MYVIEVIPLTRGSHIDTLTYYGAIDYSAGSIIEVPVRNKRVPALVVGTRPVSAAKTAVRAATFSLKKLPEQTDIAQLPPSLIETARALKKRYPAQLGAILYALLPPEIRDGRIEVQYTTPVSHADISPDISIIEGTYEDRFREYRSTIREVFAHRGSVLCVVPTSADIDRASQLLSQGIEDRLVIFSPTLSKKRLEAAYRDFYDLTSAKLILTTPTHAYIDRHDITHIIVDQSRSRYYTAKIRPYIDHREGLKSLARVTNRTMTMGDILPRSEDEYLRREEHYATLGEHPKRLTFPSTLSIIEQNEQPTGETPFKLVSEELHGVIAKGLSNKQRIFMYAARRGMAPVVVCTDCGTVARDPESGSPYTLFRTQSNNDEQRWFLSSVSGKRIRAADTCEHCGSWRLRERGIGIQHMESELNSLFPDTEIHLFDHTTATTHKKSQRIIGAFYDSKGSILLGTQMVLPYIEQPVDTSIITSHDAARSIPSWKAEEEFFALLLTLREKSSEAVYLQTRTEPDEIITYATQGAVEQFYTEELDLRKTLSYPPFSVFILLTWQDTKATVDKIETGLAHTLKSYKPRFYSAPQSIATKTRRHCLIRIKRESWPHTELLEILRTLPPYVRVEINPDRIV